MSDKETKHKMIKKSKHHNKSKQVEVDLKKEEPKRPKTAPKKSDGTDAWFDWYRDEIRDRLAKGETFDNIKKELNITHVEKFLNNER